MSNLLKAAFTSTVEVTKVATGVATQVAAVYTTAVDAAKNNSEYVKGLAEGTWANSYSNNRAQAANKAAVQYVVDKARGVVADPVEQPAG